MDKILTADPLKQILTPKEIYSMTHFENEQESSLKQCLNKWQSSSSSSLQQRVHEIN